MSHVLLGKIVGKYELGMKVQSCRSWGAERSRLGHGKGFKWILPPPPISEVIVPEPSNVCIRTVLHECILTICTSHAALSETRANRCLCETSFCFAFYLDLVISWTQKSKNQISFKSKASVINESQQMDVALLQDFSVWVCKAALLQFRYAAGKIHPDNKSLLVWNGFPVYCDNFFCLILV